MAGFKSSPSNLRKHIEVAKLHFLKSLFIIRSVLIEPLAECTRLSANMIIVENLNTILIFNFNIFVGFFFFFIK